MRNLHYLIVVLTACVAAEAARAEPHFAVQQGLKCSTCHVNPTGGGMRNVFGNTWARTVLPAAPIDLGDMEPWTGELTSHVRLGANLRADTTYTDIPDTEEQSEFDVGELRLYIDLALIPERLSLYADQRIAPGGSRNLEAYTLLWFDERQWYAKAGQFYLPFGLRLEDDGAYIREVTGINFATPDQGLEFGFESLHWSAQFAVTNGTASGPEQDQGKQSSLRAAYVGAAGRLGASFNFNEADAGDRRMQGIFAGVRTGPVAWLGEADYVVDDSFADGRRRQWVGLLEADWIVRPGHNLKLVAEYFDPDDDLDEDEQNRYSLVWEWTPIQYLQLRLGTRFYDGIPHSDLQNRDVHFAQLHGFF